MNLFSVGLPLCFLLILAYYANGNYHFSRDSWNDPSPTKDEEHAKYTAEGNLRDYGKRFYDEVDPYHKDLEKRGVKAVLFGVTLFLLLTNVGTDVFFANGGCCMVHETKDPDACNRIKNIEILGDELAQIGQQMDEEYLESQKAMTYLDNLNNQNFIFRGEINRLRDLEESIIETMQPKLINEFKTKVAEIKELLDEGKDQTNPPEIDITRMYEPLYDTWEGRFRLFSSFGLHVVSEIGEMAFDRAVFNRLRKDIALDLQTRIVANVKTSGGGAHKARKVLGGTNSIDDLSRSMAKAKLEMGAGKTKRATMVGRFSKFMTGLGIVVEIAEIFHKVKKCRDRYTTVVRAENKMKEAVAGVKETLKQIQGNRTLITNQYLDMKEAFASEKVLEVVGDFRDFVIAAAPEARRRMRVAEINLNVFFKYVQIASPSLTAKLQDWVIEGLQVIEIRYDCLLKRIRAFNLISSDCKAGLKTLPEIYEENSNEQGLHRCVTKEGELFTTFEQIKIFITEDSTNSTDKSEWYNPNCQMNNKALMDLMCSKKCQDGHKYEDILKENGITAITIDELKNVCEPKGYCERELNPNEKVRICLFKKNSLPLKMIMDLNPGFKNLDDKVKEVYDNCPKSLV